MNKSSRYRQNLRRRKAEAQGNRCCYCQRPFTTDGPTRPTLEHKKPKMDGGKNHIANLAVACQHCNQHRGAQMNRARQAARAQASLSPSA